MDDKVNILVVDDLPEKLLVYHSILDELGQNIVAARSGAEALRQVLNHEFAVILLDVNMPDMDGFETASLIRKRKKSAHTPILFVTAYLDEMLAVEGYAHGAVDYILAPVAPEVLRAKVKVFVDLHRMALGLKRQAEQSVALAEERVKRAAAEDANRSSAFLAEASNVLSNSLDLETTLRGLARLVVPFLADLSVVCLAAERSPRKIEWAWTDPHCNLTVQPGLNPPAVPVWLVHSMERVVRCGKPELLGQLDDPCQLALESPLSGPSAAQLEAAVVLPLNARGKTLGTLTLALGSDGRRFSPGDLRLAEDLASRAGVAIDNALLVQNIQEADRRKDEFLAMLAHELRNPLAPICNAAQVIRLIGPPDPKLQKSRDVIDRQLKHLTRLVDDLLDVSRITTGKIRLQLEVFDAADAIAAAVETSRPLLESRRQQLKVTLPDESIRVRADLARISQVLSNLLNNAAKYTQEAGHIWLSVAHVDGHAEFRVKDDGVGITAEVLPHVFDLFTQADRSLDRAQGGLGIGLTLVHRLVEIHGGAVQAISKGLGHGSEFIVRLPTAPAEAPAAPRPNGIPNGAAPDKKMRILVVDDNVDTAESLAMIFRLDGHEVGTAHNGVDAIDAFPRFGPDVVFLDIGLPHMDGFEVARRLRALPHGDRVLLAAITGYGNEGDRFRSLQVGFDHHLVKPVCVDDLRKLLTSRQRET